MDLFILIYRDRAYGGFGQFGGVDGVVVGDRGIWTRPYIIDRRIMLLVVRSSTWNASVESPYVNELT